MKNLQSNPKPQRLHDLRVSIRQRTGRHQSIACPWWQCQKLEAKIRSLKAMPQRLQSNVMNDTSSYFKPNQAVKSCFCNMSSRCLRQLWEQAAQQSSQPRVTILSLLDLELRWFLQSWSENDATWTEQLEIGTLNKDNNLQWRRLTTSFTLLATWSRSIDQTFLQSSGTERSSTSTVMTSLWFQLPATKEEFRNKALE